MAVLHTKNTTFGYELKNRKEPQLYRNMFPYTNVGRVQFDDVFVMPRPAEPMFITDTTFRDGQQARPPYKPKQIAALFDLLYELGGRSGLIRASEFFMYSEKDRRAIELCRSKNYTFPRVTGWIRANMDDLKLARSMGFDEVGMLTSVSDYHVYLKLGWDRKQAFNHYVKLAAQALDWGIVPRCHFEDVTRADIYGFCLPLAEKLMEMSKASGLPVKIRLCDTMGFGVPYPGATLPRSVPRLISAFTIDAGVPAEWLEWHGHNDFHKVLVNAATAWLYGCSAVSSTLLGFGERTGNTPLEGMVMEYISLTGNDDAANTKVITKIADYFRTELDYSIPDNYPFAGKDFNATSAGIHVDGLAKNQEIYNIFDTELLLDRPAPIIITDKSGRAGVAYWLNHQLDLSGENKISKSHPAVGKIFEAITAAYDAGRSTSYSNKEMMALGKRFLPHLFISDFTRLKQVAMDMAAGIIQRLLKECSVDDHDCLNDTCLSKAVESYPFIQFLYLTDSNGSLLHSVITDPAYKDKYDSLPVGYDFSQRDWFVKPMNSGSLYVTDLYKSHFTDKIILTVSAPLTSAEGEITGIIGADIQLEALLQRIDSLDEDKGNDD